MLIYLDLFIIIFKILYFFFITTEISQKLGGIQIQKKKKKKKKRKKEGKKNQKKNNKKRMLSHTNVSADNQIVEAEIREWVEGLARHKFQSATTWIDEMDSGSVLCKMLEGIDPTLKVKFKAKPFGYWGKRDNLSLFLDVVKYKCELDTSFIFEITDILNQEGTRKGNPTNVVTSLYHLSKLAHEKYGTEPPGTVKVDLEIENETEPEPEELDRIMAKAMADHSTEEASSVNIRAALDAIENSSRQNIPQVAVIEASPTPEITPAVTPTITPSASRATPPRQIPPEYNTPHADPIGECQSPESNILFGIPSVQSIRTNTVTALRESSREQLSPSASPVGNGSPEISVASPGGTRRGSETPTRSLITPKEHAASFIKLKNERKEKEKPQKKYKSVKGDEIDEAVAVAVRQREKEVATPGIAVGNNPNPNINNNVDVSGRVVRIKKGQYLLVPQRKVFYMRILRGQLMVRVGGGWEPFASWMDHLKQFHASHFGSKATNDRDVVVRQQRDEVARFASEQKANSGPPKRGMSRIASMGGNIVVDRKDSSHGLRRSHSLKKQVSDARARQRRNDGKASERSRTHVDEIRFTSIDPNPVPRFDGVSTPVLRAQGTPRKVCIHINSLV